MVVVKNLLPNSNPFLHTYTTLQRAPKLTFLTSLIIYLSLTCATSITITGKLYLGLSLFFLSFYISFLSSTGKEYGDQRRVLLHNEEYDEYNKLKLYSDINNYSDEQNPKNVKHSSEYIVNNDGQLLYTQMWQSSVNDWQQSKCLVLMIHGYSDHSSNFKHLFANWLVNNNYIVAGIDHRGHGRSDGLHVSIESFKPIVGDIIQYVQKLQKQFPNKKIIIYSESMGGGVAFRLATEHPEYFSGVVFSAPMAAISSKMQPPNFVTQILLFIMKFVPTLAITPVPDVANMAFKDQTLYKEIRDSAIYFDRNPRLSTAACMLFSSIDISNRLHELSLPFLIQHGTDDKVTDPEMSKQMFEQAQAKDKTLKLYQGGWHALLIGEAEEIMAQVRNDLLQWLNDHSSVTSNQNKNIKLRN